MLMRSTYKGLDLFGERLPSISVHPLRHAAVLIITYVLLTCTNVWQDQVVARKHVIAQGQVICSLDIKRIVDCHQITCLRD